MSALCFVVAALICAAVAFLDGHLKHEFEFVLGLISLGLMFETIGWGWAGTPFRRRRQP